MSEITNRGAAGQAAGGSLPPSNALAAGTRLHEFEIVSLVGEGGFGIVYLAKDHSLQRTVAIKEYMPGAIAFRAGERTIAVRAQDHELAFDTGLRSFINEARLLARFDHPALLKVFRFWEQHGTAYIAMPFYRGRTLKQLVRSETYEVSEANLRKLLAPLVDALTAIHEEKCYHRDISPDNILILDNDKPVLIDFGAARQIISEMTQNVTVILKPGYAPIEQYADDGKQGPWTDVYALAAVSYFAIARKAPPAAVTRLFNDPIVPLAELAPPEFSAAFLEGITRALGVRPEARPQTMAEFRELLGLKNYRASTPETPQGPAATTKLGATALEPAAPGAQTPPPREAPQPQTRAAPATQTEQTYVVTKRPSTLTEEHRDPPKWRLVAAAAAVVIVSAAGALMMFDRKGRSPPQDAPTTSAPNRDAIADGRLTAPPVQPPVDENREAAPPAPAPQPSSAPKPAASSPLAVEQPPATSSRASSSAYQVTVPLSVKPWGEVYVDDKRLGVSPPLNQINLSEGKHFIELRHPGFRNHSMLFEVREGDPEFRIVHEFK